MEDMDKIDDIFVKIKSKVEELGKLAPAGAPDGKDNINKWETK